MRFKVFGMLVSLIVTVFGIMVALGGSFGLYAPNALTGGIVFAIVGAIAFVVSWRFVP